MNLRAWIKQKLCRPHLWKLQDMAGGTINLQIGIAKKFQCTACGKIEYRVEVSPFEEYPPILQHGETVATRPGHES